MSLLLLLQSEQNNPAPAQKQAGHLSEAARQEPSYPWLIENKGALDDYNRRIESRGTFSDGLRRF